MTTHTALEFKFAYDPAAALRPAPTVAQVCAVALQADIGQLLASKAALCHGAGHDPEALHHLHVALQRFRTTARAFSLVGQDPRWRALLDQARAWARTAGQARDADVFATQSWPAARQTLGSARALSAFTRLVGAYRSHCQGLCRQAFCGPDVTAFALQALYLSERLNRGRKAWRTAHPKSGNQVRLQGKAQVRDSWNGPARRFLQVRLRHLGRNLRARLRQAQSAQDWHRARLAAKQLRYTLELALPVLPARKRHAQVLQLLARLQQHLGERNDQASAQRTARQVAALATPDDADCCAGAVARIDAWSTDLAQAQTQLRATVRRLRRRMHRLGRKH